MLYLYIRLGTRRTLIILIYYVIIIFPLPYRRYPYNIRRQNSGHNPSHSYHHHHNNNSVAGASSSPGYNNHSAGSSPSVGAHNNSNALYATAAGQQQQQPQSLPISQHDELIRYIREAWNKVRCPIFGTR